MQISREMRVRIFAIASPDNLIIMTQSIGFSCVLTKVYLRLIPSTTKNVFEMRQSTNKLIKNRKFQK